AQFVYLRDRDYVVQQGEVVIVDEFTGRLMPGRRYADGLHQAIEAKERVEVQRETITYATITLQNYFRLYRKLAGMTGTAVTEAEEFHKVYGLDVVAVPTNMPIVREDLPDFVFKSEKSKFKAAVDEIGELHRKGRPVLIGAASIEKSEELSRMLDRRGVPHEVLNAKNHEREAHIVAEAGRPGAITVSTNMAGRGTDIILGGDPAGFDSPQEWQASHDKVVGLGGLYVIGTERHDSRRIDNQLRGRSGRQGDPGATRFYGSLEDDIIKRFGGNAVGRIVNAALPEDVPLESGLLSRTMEMTQSKVEAHYFDIRKHLVEYDDVVNTQRAVVYSQRQRVLDEADVKPNVQEMLESEISETVALHLAGDREEWDADVFLAALGAAMPLPEWFDEEFVLDRTAEEVEEVALEAAADLYARKEEEFGAETMRALERAILLQTTDRLWVQHLTRMSDLRQGIGLYAYGQRDPLVMYKKEGHERFNDLRARIRRDVAHTVLHVAPASQPAQRPARNGRGANLSPSNAASPPAGAAKGKKVGRNEPCWCGSGKKFKRCHGAAA
ncbi:MAG: SEC-C domain-containing protein, partial [Dehalococcoidia bacterium]|nr:SEC-C domain-containing protein [Dehalococcoidia bacterium]